MNKLSRFILKRQVRKYSNSYLKSCIVTISQKSTMIDYDTRQIVIAEAKKRGLI